MLVGGGGRCLGLELELVLLVPLLVLLGLRARRVEHSGHKEQLFHLRSPLGIGKGWGGFHRSSWHLTIQVDPLTNWLVGNVRLAGHLEELAVVMIGAGGVSCWSCRVRLSKALDGAIRSTGGWLVDSYVGCVGHPNSLVWIAHFELLARFRRTKDG